VPRARARAGHQARVREVQGWVAARAVRDRVPGRVEGQAWVALALERAGWVRVSQMWGHSSWVWDTPEARVESSVAGI